MQQGKPTSSDVQTSPFLIYRYLSQTHGFTQGSVTVLRFCDQILPSGPARKSWGPRFQEVMVFKGSAMLASLTLFFWLECSCLGLKWDQAAEGKGGS